MAAECIGSMMMLDLDYVLPRVVSLVADATNNNSDQSTFRINICWTVATSVKFAIAGRVNTESLSKYMPKFLVLLNEEDLSVQNAALLIVYSAVHHAPKLIDVYMDEYILPHLYSTSQLILKRTVDLGPFKHTVDDALPLRKSAISIFHLCMEKSPGLVDINNFLPILVKALDDVEDIQLQAHQIVLLMCSRYPAVLTSSIDSLVNPLERSVNKKPSALKSGNELDRSVELVKSALRVMMALNQVDGASK
jgi:cullin-associated NEDD8-dissociated protein 1